MCNARENREVHFLFPPDARRIINADVSRDTLANNHPEILFRANNMGVEFRFQACRAIVVPFAAGTTSFSPLRSNNYAGRETFPADSNRPEERNKGPRINFTAR